MYRQLLLKTSMILIVLTLTACTTQHTMKMTPSNKTVILEKLHAKFAHTGLNTGSTRHSVLLNQPTYRWFSEGNKLSPASKQKLSYVAKLVMRIGYNKIIIGGYSDNVGGLMQNKAKSHNWAKSIYSYLISQGISRNKISYKGHGEFEPMTSNFTESGRRENRRVEIRIE